MKEIYWIRVVVWTTVVALLGVMLYEIYRPEQGTEGFFGGDGVGSIGNSAFWSKLVPRRGDIGPELEIAGLVRDTRYFVDYADVQRFSAKTDFCRMVRKKEEAEEETFFACALGGSENSSTIAYRSPSVKDGFLLSRDDYMRDTNGDGREDYCRILNTGSQFEPMCNPADDFGFNKEMLLDPNPPDDIQTLLNFYQGAMFWLRLYDDMLDYTGNLVLSVGGGAQVVEDPPKPKKTKALRFDGTRQFLRLGDDRKLRFGSKVLLRQMRAVCFWVKFDEFTNNAKVFDFGNGAGMDNVFVGIVGRGNMGLLAKKQFPNLCESTVPSSPSGQQPVVEVHPQKLMKTTCANVDEFECKGMAVEPVIKPREGVILEKGDNADMIYEIWEGKTRKMHIIVPKAFIRGEWTHIAITATSPNAFRPELQIYRNGKLVYVEVNGWLPTVSNTASNYIGKSNWYNVTSQYTDRDELLKGSVFDIRGYNTPLSKQIIRDSVIWGREKLGMEPIEFNDDA